MQLAFLCPKCECSTLDPEPLEGRCVRCGHCDWSRSVPDDAVTDSQPVECLVCGCGDLWRQKEFPARLGLLMVATGAVGSTIAWSLYEPLWAIGILMAFGLIDLLLFAIMPDVLVCYRCGARHRDTQPDESIPQFDLEIAEKYRQEEIRLQEAEHTHTEQG